MTSYDHLNAAEFSAASDDVFGRIAARYDLLCDLFSFGIHRIWKQKVAAVIAGEEWQLLLDAATGTGDIAMRVLARYQGSGRVLGSDISPQMLAIARTRLPPSTHHQIDLRVLDAHAMPSVLDNSVCLYSMSFALKICDRGKVLREALRVLRPGGRLVILEASTIRWRALHVAYLIYMSLCMPLIGWIATRGDASAYRYLLQGVREFPAAESLATEIQRIGFTDVTYERLSLGIVAIHTARKRSEAAA